MRRAFTTLLLLAQAAGGASGAEPARPASLGGTLVYHARYGDQSDIYLSRDGGVTSTRLTTHPAEDTSPRLSPDGLRVVFQSTRAGKPHLFQVATRGGAPTQLTTGDFLDQAPCWSPDGEWVYFESNRGRHSRICRVPAAGGALEAITPDTMDTLAPAVSPDGDRIACQVRTQDETAWRIGLFDLAGNLLLQVGAADSELNETPSFSGDGQGIYFAAATGRDYQLFRFDLANDALTQLTDSPGWKLHPCFVRDGLLLFDWRSPEGWRLGGLELETGETFTLAPAPPVFAPHWAPSRE